MNLPFLVCADSRGTIYIHPSLRVAAKAWDVFCVPSTADFIPAPEGTIFYYLPGRNPVGFHRARQSFEHVTSFHGRKVFAVSAFLPPAYLRLYHPACSVEKFQILPLWNYIAAGWYAGKFYVAALRIDKKLRQSPRFYRNRHLLIQNIASMRRLFSKNRLLQHLSFCALRYNCLAAQNFFLQRWEAPLPCSPACNSRCIGCLSLQKDFCASHERICFVPTVEEVSQLGIFHLKRASEAIVSFGQGCEGEPLLEEDLLVHSIRAMRQATSKGTIHMNTNASRPKSVERVCTAGINSIRVSLNSAREDSYCRYFRPVGYTFSDVLESIRIARKKKVFVSVNLLTFPGFTDSYQEAEALFTFIARADIQMVQMRNLNIDPEYYMRTLQCKPGSSMGMRTLVAQLRKKFRRLKIGYFNVSRSEFAG